MSELTYAGASQFIGGEFRDGTSAASTPVINPATEVEICRFSHASPADLDEALNNAAVAFARWRKSPPLMRSDILRKAAELMRRDADAIARVMTMEAGKPLAESIGELKLSWELMEWYAEECRRLYGRLIPARADGVEQIVHHEPVGPVAAFTPWNFPVSQVVRKVAAAVAAGCSIIIKVAEDAPASGLALARLLKAAGLPDGVVQVVIGDPAEISAHLLSSPVIRKMSFTGSVPVGRKLAALAGDRLIRMTMELGGHAPVIISNDVDIDKVADAVAAGKIRNGGQVCVSPTRFIVHQDVFDKMSNALAERFDAVTVGDGLDANSRMGPMIHARRRDAIERMAEDAVAKGARLLAGGHREHNRGYFWRPTLVADVPLEASMMKDEPFGPIASINPYSTLDDAIAEANRLPFGLAAYAFAGSAKAQHQLASEVETGMLSINHFGLGLAETPFGGVKDSGWGSEGGTEGLAAYLSTKFVSRAA